MENNKSFFRSVCALAIPVTLQSMLQSSFSIVDQIMIGQLGSVSVAGVGLAGKFSSIHSVIVAAVGAVAGIMISQYLGQNNKQEVRRSFYTNLLLAVGIAGLFTLLCVLFPSQIMGLYTKDAATRQEAAAYLLIITGTYLPLAGATLLSTLLRCMEKPKLPLYASMASAGVNTVVNYILIFGKLGFPVMGAAGAAIATVLSQWVNCLLMLLMLPKQALDPAAKESTPAPRMNWKQYFAMLAPHSHLRTVLEFGRKRLRHHLRPHGHRCHRRHDPYQSHSGVDDRGALRPVSGGQHPHWQEAGQRR